MTCCLGFGVHLGCAPFVLLCRMGLHLLLIVRQQPRYCFMLVSCSKIWGHCFASDFGFATFYRLQCPAPATARGAAACSTPSVLASFALQWLEALTPERCDVHPQTLLRLPRREDRLLPRSARQTLPALRVKATIGCGLF